MGNDLLAFFATFLNYVHRLSFNYLSADGELRKLIPDEAFGYIGTAFFVAYTILERAFRNIDRQTGHPDWLFAVYGFLDNGRTFSCVCHYALAVWHLQVFTGYRRSRQLAGCVKAYQRVVSAARTFNSFRHFQQWLGTRRYHSTTTDSGDEFPLWVAIHFYYSCRFRIPVAVVFWFSYYTPNHSVKEAKARTVPPLKLLKNSFVSRLLLAKIFIEPVWYFVTFWIGRYLVDVHHWDLKTIGWYAMIPFIMADVGNIAGGYFTQYIIKKGVPIPPARKIALGLSGVLMSAPLVIAPFVVTTPMSALIIFGVSGFGYTSYTANALALTADVVPKSAAASAWGLACIGNGIGGAVFQSLSGLTLTYVTAAYSYTAAYNVLFVIFGVCSSIGLIILLFFMGPFVKNRALQEYVEAEPPYALQVQP